MILLSVFGILFILYSILIIYYRASWKKIPFYTNWESKKHTRVSIIIPARNEEQNIGNLLNVLKEQNYPGLLTEIIVVDDHSTDATAAIVRQFKEIKLVSLNEEQINSYKKKAIEKGIEAATGELIITTDADCIPGKNWLETIASFKELNDSVFIVAPVCFKTHSSLLSVFQSLDFITLQGITGAAVASNKLSMCNGANLAYEKNVFHEVNGFAGIDSIASGDDMLLMHKIWKTQPGLVHYLKSKDAIVETLPADSWKSFLNQRIRWASKATFYTDKRITAVLALVYLFNLSFLVFLIAGFWNHLYWLYLLIALLAKTIIELPFVYTVAKFFGQQSLIKYFPLLQPLHITYTIIAGWLGQFGTYEWKGRKVK
jgi:poly-beta-1,6-N-acetyl-D-glucosamine synthase